MSETQVVEHEASEVRVAAKVMGQEDGVYGARFLVPVRLSAWLAGGVGRLLQGLFEDVCGAASVTRLPRGILVENGGGVDALQDVIRVMRDVEVHVAEKYPVFYHEMGPVLTGTVNVVLEKKAVA